LNKFCVDNYPATQNYPDYHAHATIAYLKKGKGKEYVEAFSEISKIEVIADRMVYSRPEGLPNRKKYWDMGKNMNYLELQKGLKGMTLEKVGIIQDFVCFCRDKLQIKNRVFVSLRGERDEYIGTTAAYSPNEDKNFVRCNGRALVDIMRSIAHELVHNAQREQGLFKVGDEIPTTGFFIEDQANALAGTLIKDYTVNHGNMHIHDID
jgi:hypothetical protein